MPKSFYSYILASASGVKREVKCFCLLWCQTKLPANSLQILKPEESWDGTLDYQISRTGFAALVYCCSALLMPGCCVERSSAALLRLNWALIRFSFLNVSAMRIAGHFLDVRGKTRGRVWLNCWSDWFSQLLWSWLVASNTGKLQWAAWKYRKHKDMEEADNGQRTLTACVKMQ